MTPELAIANNHAWYLSIFNAHGRASRLEEHYWSTDAEPPPYYSRLVTRTRGGVAREAQLRRLSELNMRAAGRGWGCKDSFDELPSAALEKLGLRPLFRAHWYGWAAGGASPEPETRLKACRIEAPEALSSWEAHWRSSSPAGDTPVFPATVLADSSLALFTMTLEGRAAGGFALNRSEGAIGLSNVFQLEGLELDSRIFVRECARMARWLHPDRAVVGYGSESVLESLASLGFGSLGPLCVWVAP
jgi:hypothetical protein